jgi:LPXTG-motif cell wall-anchored protein
MNVRRTTATLALTGVLALAPAAAAMADTYPADEPNMTVSAGTEVTPGQGFTTTISAPNGTPVTLTISSDSSGVTGGDIEIAGTASLTKTAGEQGVDNAAVFTVTMHAPGTFNLVATDAAGNVLASQTMTVAGDAVGGGDEADAGTISALPVTGGEVVLYTIGAGLLIAAGTAVVVTARRRRNATG